jgi:hypothetical protein
MAGKVLKVVQKRVFDFGNTATPTSLVLTLAERIDISQYIDCMLNVRVHSSLITGSNSITFDLYGDGYTTEEPGLVFRTPSPLFTSLPVTFGGPALFTYGGTIHGQYAALVMTGSHATAGAVNAIVSIDMILRTPDERVPD